MFLVGIDVIGGKVVEINAESPGGLQSVERLYDVDVAPPSSTPWSAAPARDPEPPRRSPAGELTDGLDGVDLRDRLVVPVAQHAGEAQRHAARVAASTSAPRRTRSRRPARAQPDDPLTRVGVRRRRARWNRSVCHASISSVIPLKVLPSMTSSPVSASRAPRWMLDSQPRRRPLPHSTASTTRSRVCRGLTLTHPGPRRPAAYGSAGSLTTTPSCPAATMSAKNCCASLGVGGEARAAASHAGGTVAGEALPAHRAPARRAGPRRRGGARRRRTASAAPPRAAARRRRCSPCEHRSPGRAGAARPRRGR